MLAPPQSMESTWYSSTQAHSLPDRAPSAHPGSGMRLKHCQAKMTFWGSGVHRPSLSAFPSLALHISPQPLPHHWS